MPPMPPANIAPENDPTNPNSDLYSVFSRGFEDNDELGQINNILFSAIKARPDDPETFFELAKGDEEAAKRLGRYNNFFRQRLRDFREQIPDQPEQRRIELVRRAAVDEALIEDLAQATGADRTKLRSKAAKVYASNLAKFRAGELNRQYDSPAHATNDFLLRQVGNVQARFEGEEARSDLDNRASLNPLTYPKKILGGIGEGIKAGIERPTEPFSPGGVFSTRPATDKRPINRYAASFVEGALGVRPESEPRPELDPAVTDPRTGERTEGEGALPVIADRTLGVAGTVAAFLGFGAGLGKVAGAAGTSLNTAVAAGRLGRLTPAAQKTLTASQYVAGLAPKAIQWGASRGLTGRFLAGTLAEGLRSGPKLLAFAGTQRGLGGGDPLDTEAIEADAIMAAINAGAIGAADELAAVLRKTPDTAKIFARYGEKEAHQKFASKIGGQLVDVKPGDLKGRALSRIVNFASGVDKANIAASAERTARIARASAGLLAGYGYDRWNGVSEIDALTSGLFFSLVDLAEKPGHVSGVEQRYRAKVAQAKAAGQRIEPARFIGESIAEAAEASPDTTFERRHAEIWRQARSEMENVLAEDLAVLRSQVSNFALSSGEAEMNAKRKADLESAPVQGPEKVKPGDLPELPAPDDVNRGILDKAKEQAGTISELRTRIAEIEKALKVEKADREFRGQTKKDLTDAQKKTETERKKARKEAKEKLKTAESNLRVLRDAVRSSPEISEARNKRQAELGKLNDDLARLKEQYRIIEGNERVPVGEEQTGTSVEPASIEKVDTEGAESDQRPDALKKAQEYRERVVPLKEAKRQAEIDQLEQADAEIDKNAPKISTAKAPVRKTIREQPSELPDNIRDKKLADTLNRIKKPRPEKEPPVGLAKREAYLQAERQRIESEIERIGKEVKEAQAARKEEERAFREPEFKAAEEELRQQEIAAAKQVELPTGKKDRATRRAEPVREPIREADAKTEAKIEIERGQARREKRQLQLEREKLRAERERNKAAEARFAKENAGPQPRRLPSKFTQAVGLERIDPALKREVETQSAEREFRDQREAKTAIPRLETDTSPRRTPERIDTSKAPENVPDLFQAEKAEDFIERFASDWLARIPTEKRPEFARNYGIKRAAEFIKRYDAGEFPEARVTESRRKLLQAYKAEVGSRRRLAREITNQKLAESKAVKEHLERFEVKAVRKKPALDKQIQAAVGNPEFIGRDSFRSTLGKAGRKLSAREANAEFKRLSEANARYNDNPDAAAHLTGNAHTILTSRIDTNKTAKADFDSRVNELANQGRGIFRQGGFEAMVDSLRELNVANKLTRPELLTEVRQAYIDAIRDGENVDKAMGEYYSAVASERLKRFETRVEADRTVELAKKLNEKLPPPC